MPRLPWLLCGFLLENSGVFVLLVLRRILRSLCLFRSLPSPRAFAAVSMVKCVDMIPIAAISAIPRRRWPWNAGDTLLPSRYSSGSFNKTIVVTYLS
jgi:hypothetical protein